jgi:hypothetical protein
MISSEKLQAYVGYCPSCGSKLRFNTPYRNYNVESVHAKCTSMFCKKEWAIIFDLDESGTFGVMSFQCDNQDRIM